MCAYTLQQLIRVNLFGVVFDYALQGKYFRPFSQIMWLAPFYLHDLMVIHFYLVLPLT
jgi:hypothetical protein